MKIKGTMYTVVYTNSQHEELAVGTNHEVVSDLEYSDDTKTSFCTLCTGWYAEDSFLGNLLVINSLGNAIAVLAPN